MIGFAIMNFLRLANCVGRLTLLHYNQPLEKRKTGFTRRMISLIYIKLPRAAGQQWGNPSVLSK